MVGDLVGDTVGSEVIGDGDGVVVGASAYCELAPGVVSRSASNSRWASLPVQDRLVSASELYMNRGVSVAKSGSVFFASHTT